MIRRGASSRIPPTRSTVSRPIRGIRTRWPDLFRGQQRARPSGPSRSIAADGPRRRRPGRSRRVTRRLASRFWPGPLDVAREGRCDVSRQPCTAATRLVGVRVPDSIVARALALAAGGLITATSANRSVRRGHSDPDALAASGRERSRPPARCRARARWPAFDDCGCHGRAAAARPAGRGAMGPRARIS